MRSAPYLTREIRRLQTLRRAAFDNCTYTRLEIEVRMQIMLLVLGMRWSISITRSAGR